MYLKSIAAALLGFSLSGQALAQQPAQPADAALSRALVGTWITPPGSPDYLGIAARHHFNADGTSLFHVYKDDACREDSFQLSFNWSVQNGVLILVPQQGAGTHEEIVSIDKGKMVLRSLHDGATYSRLKSESCPTQMLPGE